MNIAAQIQESIQVKQDLLQSQLESIQKAGELCAEAIQSGGKLLFCGNGGSACDASHIVAELVVRYKSGNDRKALPAIALSSDLAILTAGANDYGYESVFERQVEALGKKGDVFVGISTSGNSENVRRAFVRAREEGLRTLALLGGNGGKILGLADVAVVVPSFVTARIQESHILVGHILCSWIEKSLFELD